MPPLRYTAYLRGRYRVLIRYVGEGMLLAGLIFLLPLFVVFFDPVELALTPVFLAIALPLLIGGLLLWRLPRGEAEGEISATEGAVIALLLWVVMCLLGTLPYLTLGNLNFLLALFESVSGFSTTGLSVLDVLAAPPILLLYRSITQVVGGAGFAILVVSSLLPGPAGAGLFSSEGRQARFVPNVAESANIVLRIYAVYVLAGALALWLAGMTPFEAINHSMTAVSTAGFSTRPESIAYWDSPTIEAVIIVLMLLGSFSFFTAHLIYSGRLRQPWRDAEIRTLAFSLPLATLLLALWVGPHLGATPAGAFRAAIFEAVAAVSTTGFSTLPLAPLPDLAIMILALLMLMGGATESTAGGIKQYRIYILARAYLWDIRRAFLPPGIANEPSAWRGGRREFLTSDNARQTALFVLSYLALVALGMLVLTGFGFSLRDSLFEVSSAMGGVGASIGITHPDAPPGVLLTLIAAMFLGRLEILTVFIGVARLAADFPALLGWRSS